MARYIFADDPLRQAFNYRRFAYSRLTDQHRVILSTATKDSNHSLQLFVAANHRIKIAVGRSCCQIHTKGAKCPAARITAAPRLGSNIAMFAAILFKRLLEFTDYHIDVDTHFAQQRCRSSVTLAQNTVQNVLCAEIIMAILARRFPRHAQCQQSRLAKAHHTSTSNHSRRLDIQNHFSLLQSHAGVSQYLRRRARPLRQNAEQQVLRPNVITTVTASNRVSMLDASARVVGQSRNKICKVFWHHQFSVLSVLPITANYT